MNSEAALGGCSGLIALPSVPPAIPALRNEISVSGNPATHTAHPAARLQNNRFGFDPLVRVTVETLVLITEVELSDSDSLQLAVDWSAGGDYETCFVLEECRQVHTQVLIDTK